MAKHSIYLDAYHEVLSKHLAKSSTLSSIISKSLDIYFRYNWNKLPKDTWESLVNDLAKRSLDVNVNNITLSQLRKAVLECLTLNQNQ